MINIMQVDSLNIQILVIQNDDKFIVLCDVYGTKTEEHRSPMRSI